VRDLPADVTSARVAATARAPRVRERRIDVFRGLALAMIFINHAPETVYETLTSRNFGFSDAAEGFVFLSGTSAALAYAGAMAAPRLWPGIARIWGRSWTLYLVHLFVSAWVIAIAAATWVFGESMALLERDNLQFLLSDPFGVLIGLPLMTHQIGYVNILPMYAMLLLATPGLLIAATRWPGWTLAGSVGLWVAASLFGLNLPNYPTGGGWFLNPLSWQLLFTLGILTGVALRAGRRFVPRSRVLTAASWAMLALALVWIKLPDVAEAGNAFMVRLADAGLPPLIRDFDKTYLCVPRLAHALALIYLLSSLACVERLSQSRWTEPLAVMGRMALPVFALGTILSFAVRAVKAVAGDTFLLDSLLIATGLAIMWAFARSRDASRRAVAV